MTDAIFIDVEISGEIAGDAELAKKLEEVCPVDIFTSANDTPETAPENLDECVLCELCIEAAPPGAVVVKKLYDGTDLRR
jgi:NAD-dependent dihydropyrimidine dehydrogenase PreA subunit